MRRALARIFVAEIIVAMHFGAFGEWWAASAARRLGKVSARFPKGAR
jgi:hypothetical protein